MKKRRLFSIILSLALTFGSMSVAIADEVQLPTPEEIDSMHLLTPILEAETEAESETALQALADLDADGKLLALAQIAEFAEEQNDPEILIAFLPYIGEDLMDSLEATTATAILESNAYSDLFKIYVIDFAHTLDNFSSASYNEALVDVAMDSSKSDELRVYAAHDIDTSMVSNPVAVYETLYDDASSMDDKMLMLKDIGFVDPATARELSLDVLDNYESYESRIVTMANKAYVRSINGEQELIDDIIARNREMMATGDAELINGCVLALSELEEPEAVELILSLPNLDELSGKYELVERNISGVMSFLEKQDSSTVKKIIEAIPVEQFIPLIKEKLSDNPREMDQVINTIESASSEVLPYATSSNLEGYAIYRDGVGAWEFDAWHAGIITEANSTKESITSIVHHSGEGVVGSVNYNTFENGNNFKGVYRKTTSTTTRGSIVRTADQLTTEAIAYTFTSLLTYRDGMLSNSLIHPEDITGIRCDGVVEYCYEYNNVIIRAGSIATPSGADTHNAASQIYIPRHQASMMTVVIDPE